MTESPKMDLYIGSTGDIVRVARLLGFFDQLAATKGRILGAMPMAWHGHAQFVNDPRKSFPKSKQSPVIKLNRPNMPL